MSNEKDKGLDDLFRKKLEDPVDEIRYEEGDWDALEQMLDKHKRKKGIIYLLPILSGVAALFLLFLGWWLYRPQVSGNNKPDKLQAATKHPKTINGLTTEPNKNINKQQGEVTDQKTPATSNYASNLNTGKSGIAGSSSYNKSKAIDKNYTTNTEKTKINNIANGNSTEMLTAENTIPVFGSRTLANQGVSSVQLHNNNIINAGNTTASKTIKGKLKPLGLSHPQYALTVLAAPDVNGVGSFQQGKVGTNFGLQFSAGVTRKLTITTGALYSDKPYTAGYGSYHISYQFTTNPVNVVADCRMIDIPINVGYQLYNKHQNKISLGTGLSSYIMLHESYKFNYADAATPGPSYYNVPNSNKYFLGVLNLNATYDHQINSKVGIQVQPYLKLPLTNIGYSQVRLQTTGVAIGLRWNLNSMSKP